MEHPDYPGYLIYNDGRIWSKKSNIWMKQANDKDGYKKIKLMVKAKPYHMRIHRLVAEVYLPNPKLYDQVNHINGKRDDNSINNLEWCSKEENHLSINMTKSNFGTVGQVLCHNKHVWRHQIRIYKKDFSRHFQTQQEAKLYQLLLKYCFYIRVNERRLNQKEN